VEVTTMTNKYVVDDLVKGGTTRTLNDDSGIDWLEIHSLYDQPTDIRLAWTTDAFGFPTSAMGFYFESAGIGNRLVVQGEIENARGSIGRDFIQGSVLDNVIYGDLLRDGPGMEDTLWGGAGDDRIFGGAGDDRILGDSGDDRLFGDSGDDVISGGSGSDTIEGGPGADILSGGGDAGDTASYDGSRAAVRVALTFGDTTIGRGGDAEGDRLHGFRNLIGSDYGDRLSDTVKGSVAFGGNANTFDGGRGNDRLDMGGGNDRAIGGSGNDTLRGEAGDDTLEGGSGDDILEGGAGADRLRGGAGADRFVFRYLADSGFALDERDTILDFTPADGDRIVLKAIDADPSTAVDDAFRFIGSARFSGQAGELRAVASGANVLVWGDVDGDKRADLAILLRGVIDVSADDFIL
jgi:Ca2+-binding RTX toxin-like protein